MHRDTFQGMKQNALKVLLCFAVDSYSSTEATLKVYKSAMVRRNSKRTTCP